MKINPSAVLIKDVFWRQFWSSAYKGISLFSEDINGPVLIDILYVQFISNPSPDLQSVHSPSDTLFISLKRVELVTCTTSSHYTPFCQSSSWISTKRNKRIKRLFLLCSCPESQRLQQSLPPGSFHVAPRSVQDAQLQTLVSPTPVSSYWSYEGAGRKLKTLWRRNGSRRFDPSPLSSIKQLQEMSTLSISSQKKLGFHGRWNLKKKQTYKAKITRGSFVIKTRLLQSLIRSYL